VPPVSSPIHIEAGLAVRIGGQRVPLTPSQGLRLAERLIRVSTRKMMAEEAVRPLRRTRMPRCRAALAALFLAVVVALANGGGAVAQVGGNIAGGGGIVTSGTAILKGNGSGGVTNATSGTDYAPAPSGAAILKGNGSGGFVAAVAQTDYAPVCTPNVQVLISGTSLTTPTCGGNLPLYAELEMKGGGGGGVGGGSGSSGATNGGPTTLTPSGQSTITTGGGVASGGTGGAVTNCPATAQGIAGGTGSAGGTSVSGSVQVSGGGGAGANAGGGGSAGGVGGAAASQFRRRGRWRRSHILRQQQCRHWRLRGRQVRRYPLRHQHPGQLRLRHRCGWFRRCRWHERNRRRRWRRRLHPPDLQMVLSYARHGAGPVVRRTRPEARLLVW
jgi:hypothetical protein